MPKDRSFFRLTRITVILIALASVLTAGAATAAAKTGAGAARADKEAQALRTAHVAGTLPPEGIFDGCDITSNTSTCAQDLQTIHQAGLQVVVANIPLGATLDELSSYAAAAQSTGVSVMWELNDAGFWGGTWTATSAAYDYSEFSNPCGCTDTAGVLTYMIQWLAALPATYGYYAADDSTLTPDQTTGLTQYVSEIKSADSNHVAMIGSTPFQGTTYYATGATIGNEIYPETTSDLWPASQNLANWDGVQQTISQDQQVSTRSGTASAFILQAFSFGDNLDDGEAVGVCTPDMSASRCASLLRYPSANVQLELRNEVLEHAHPKLILWYTFGQADAQSNRWVDLTKTVTAPFPGMATAARAKHIRGHRKTITHRHHQHHSRKQVRKHRHHQHHSRKQVWKHRNKKHTISA